MSVDQNEEQLYSFVVHEMTREQREQKFIDLLKSTHRPKIDVLINHLIDLGMMVACGSMKHHPYEGGLLVHSLETCEWALKNRHYFLEQGWGEEDIPMDSLIISALLHDVCKADSLRYDYQVSNPVRVKIQFRHGTISIRKIKECGFELKEIEEMAIYNHMGFKRLTYSVNEHFRTHPLSYLIYLSDWNSIDNSPIAYNKPSF